MTLQSQDNSLNYLINATFTKVNRLFVLPFERIEENNVKILFCIILYQTSN